MHQNGQMAMSDETPPPEIAVHRADWRRNAERLLGVRREVFVVEQDVPEAIEVDGRDPKCYHAMAVDDAGQLLGVARMTDTGHIGRVAVRRPWRGQGIGTSLVRFFIELAKELHLDSVDLDSQTDALAFYEQLGFTPRGEEFEEAGIQHVNMGLRLDK